MNDLKTPQRPPGYELFFTPLAVSLDPNEYEQIQFAYFAAKFGHAKKVRDDGSRAFDHPKASAWIYIDELKGRDVRTIVDCFLHDISEDTYLLSSYRIARNFGKDIALDVRALTKLPKGKETTEEYMGRIIARGPHAIVTKLCDRLHNLRTLGSAFPEKQQKQITETQQYHLKLLVPALNPYDDKWEDYGGILKKKIEEAISHLHAHLQI